MATNGGVTLKFCLDKLFQGLEISLTLGIQFIQVAYTDHELVKCSLNINSAGIWLLEAILDCDA